MFEASVYISALYFGWSDSFRVVAGWVGGWARGWVLRAGAGGCGWLWVWVWLGCVGLELRLMAPYCKRYVYGIHARHCDKVHARDGPTRATNFRERSKCGLLRGCSRMSGLASLN